MSNSDSDNTQQQSASFASELPADFWEQLTDIVAEGAVVDRPFREITIYRDEDAQSYFGVVSIPTAVMDSEPVSEDADLFDDCDGAGDRLRLIEEYDKNEPVELTGELAEHIHRVVSDIASDIEYPRGDSLRETLKSIYPAQSTSSAGFVRLTVREDGAHILFNTYHETPPELYEMFRELMVTLGHAESTDVVTHGTGLQPERFGDDEHKDSPVNLGMSATAYRLVSDPHVYWGDLDSLEEYIDRAVENGADRAELEARDTYHHHFHPQTDHRDLSATQIQALSEWEDAVTAHTEDQMTVTRPTLRDSVGDVSFTKDGDGCMMRTLVFGDEIPLE